MFYYMDTTTSNISTTTPTMYAEQPFNIIQILVLLSPFFLISSITSMSFVFQNFKGLIYLGFILVAVISRYFIMKHSGNKPISFVPSKCNFIQYSKYGNSTFSTFVFAFTLAYIASPMIYNGIMNWFILCGILLYSIIDLAVKHKNGCINLNKESGMIFLNILTGLFSGWLITFLFLINKNEKYLFFNEISSNRDVCSQPKKQTFKCAVYKNGELIDNVTA